MVDFWRLSSDRRCTSRRLTVGVGIFYVEAKGLPVVCVRTLDDRAVLFSGYGGRWRAHTLGGARDPEYIYPSEWAEIPIINYTFW